MSKRSLSRLAFCLLTLALSAPAAAQSSAEPGADGSPTSQLSPPPAGPAQIAADERPEASLAGSAPAAASAPAEDGPDASDVAASASPVAPIAPPAPPAASRGELSSFGNDVVVPEGQVVDSVSSFGGDVVVLGRVLRDVSSFGGDVLVRGQVDGDVSSFGGEVTVPGSVRGAIASGGGDVHVTGDVRGAIDSFGGQISRGASDVAALGAVPAEAGFFASLGRFLSFAGSRALSALFVFLLGLMLLGLAPERLERSEVAMVRAPAKVLAHGLVVVVVSALAMVVMVLSVLGIPAALLYAMVFPIACYVALAATARVVGALLPTDKLRERPIAALGAGVALLYLASLVPFVGSLVLAAALLCGLGALSATRFGTRDVQPPTETAGPGPFRARPVEA